MMFSNAACGKQSIEDRCVTKLELGHEDPECPRRILWPRRHGNVRRRRMRRPEARATRTYLTFAAQRRLNPWLDIRRKRRKAGRPAATGLW